MIYIHWALEAFGAFCLVMFAITCIWCMWGSFHDRMGGDHESY